jgi:hypothetical protein
MSAKNRAAAAAAIEKYAAERLAEFADRLVERMESGGLDPVWAADLRERSAHARSAAGGRAAAAAAFLSDPVLIGPSTEDEETLWDAAWLEALRAAADVVRGET